MRAKIAAIVVGVLSTAGIVGTALPSAAAVTPDVNCIQNPATNAGESGNFAGTNVNIRTGPFTSCTAVGEGQPSHSVTFRCAKVNSNGVLWVYLTDHTISRTGWSEARFLGAFVLPSC